jgi:hypothetical protein
MNLYHLKIKRSHQVGSQFHIIFALIIKKKNELY